MLRRLRLVGTMAVVALLALFMVVPLAGAAPRTAETKTVSIKDFVFDPKTISINVGDTITWTNDGAAPHTVSADDASFDSGNLDKGATFSRTFDTAGTFAYFCKYHGSKGGVSMAGSVAVAAPAAAAPAQAANDSVTAADQAIANSGITVANVTAGQDGWIVAHLDEGGKPGKVIGHTAVKTGDNKNVVIALSEDVPAGGKLWPMLHIDAGAIGTYEFPGPDAPVIVGGNIIMKQISVTAAGAAAPVMLPTTGGEDVPVGLLLAAFGLLLAGALLTLRPRRA